MNNTAGTLSDSSSLFDVDIQSTMDNNGRHRHHNRKTLAKAHSLTTTATISHHRHTANLFNGYFVEGESYSDDDECSPDDGGGGDSEMWNNFNHSFQQVQSVLDRNRVLIQQVNDNHQSKIHDNLVQNVSLINEINGNISKVVSLYSDLSVNFSNTVHREIPQFNPRSTVENLVAGVDRKSPFSTSILLLKKIFLPSSKSNPLLQSSVCFFLFSPFWCKIFNNFLLKERKIKKMASVSMAMQVPISAAQKKVQTPFIGNPLPVRSPATSSPAKFQFKVKGSLKEKAITGITAAALTASMVIPDVAVAAESSGLSPSLKNFLLSIVAGGIVVAAIAGAVVGVSNFDPVKRS